MPSSSGAGAADGMKRAGMAEGPGELGRKDGVEGHARWVRISHWIVTVSVLVRAFTGFEILMVHPRLTVRWIA